jgi:mannose-6-phosphate isomerase-like protein (cupin superfamily)
MIVSDARQLAQYKGGADCDAYVLVYEPALSVKLEQLQPGACGTLLFHQRSQQFLYVLAGEASMKVAEGTLQQRKSEGVLLEAGARHHICNHGAEPLRFVVTSQPAVGHHQAKLNQHY